MHSLLQILIFLLSNISPYNFQKSSGVTQLLLQMNSQYKTDLNIFINLENIFRDTLDFKQLETPALQLQTSINTFHYFRLLGSFTEKTLVIVNIKEPPLDSSVINILPYLLRRLHELHLVFLTEEDPSLWQNDLYKFCFTEGFINTLLIYHRKKNHSLYSYNPYPEIQTLKILEIEDYFNRWRILENFHNFPIRTLPDESEPRKISYVNRQGQTVHAGYMYNTLLEFARRHNATLTLEKPVPDNEQFLEAFARLARKELDIVCYHMEITWNKSSTTVLHLLRSYIIVPHARPIASYLYFGRPFTWTLWLAVIATVVYGMVMLYGSDRSEFGLHFLSSWCHLLFLSQPVVIFSNWQQYAIHFILILSGFILTNLYLALLSSMLTSGLFEAQFNSLQDLIHSPYPWLVDQYYVNFFNNSVYLPSELKNRLTPGWGFKLQRTRIGLNTSFMYSLYDDRLEGILYQQHLLKVPRFKKIPESTMDALMALITVDSLPYLNMFNSYLRRTFECGIFSKMKSDSWRDAIEGGIYTLMRSEGVEQKPFDLEFYFYAFLLWALGLTLAAMCFILELIRWRLT